MYMYVRTHTTHVQAQTHTQIVQSCTCIHCTCTHRIHTCVHNAYDFSFCIPQIDSAALIEVDFPVSLGPIATTIGQPENMVVRRL